MNALAIVLLVCGISVTAISVFLFVCGCRIAAIPEDYGYDSLVFTHQRRAIFIFKISYVFLFMGLVMFIAFAFVKV